VLILASECHWCGAWAMQGRYPEANCLRCDTLYWKSVMKQETFPN